MKPSGWSIETDKGTPRRPSTTLRPILCRVPSYFLPGFPNPTTILIGGDDAVGVTFLRVSSPRAWPHHPWEVGWPAPQRPRVSSPRRPPVPRLRRLPPPCPS